MITIFSYDPSWVEQYETESSLLVEAIGGSIIELHHIGSTSVVGLSAKRDIDILCVVDRLAHSLLLEEKGYQFKGEFNVPLRYFFSKNTEYSKVNLHVVESQHNFINMQLCFRNYLRNTESARVEYTELKKKLLLDLESHEKSSSGLTFYTLGKNEFIKTILFKAAYDRMIVNFCTHDFEWEEYYRIKFERLGVISKMRNAMDCHFILYSGVKLLLLLELSFYAINVLF